MSAVPLARTCAAVAGALIMAAGLVTSAASAAEAAVPGDCPYPYVCFYDTKGKKTGQFRDITSQYQTVGASAYASRIYNSRKDDGARIRYSDGYTRCVKPGESSGVSRGHTKLTGIRISSSPTC